LTDFAKYSMKQSIARPHRAFSLRQLSFLSIYTDVKENETLLAVVGAT